jgi:putative aldouronate transport system permease protein
MMKMTVGEKIFQAFAYLALTAILLAVLFPMLNVLATSLSSYEAVAQKRVTIYPIGFMTESYRQLVTDARFTRAMLNTILITAAGTSLAVLVCASAAYVMSTEFMGKKIVTAFFVATMYFGGGLIPTYIVYTQYLHLRGTYWVMFLPLLFSMFYVIVIKSQIDAIPHSLFDAATVDGASEHHKLFVITIPMITPTIAAIAMFFALGFWNSWFNVMVYQTKTEMWTLQYFLRCVVFTAQIAASKAEIGMMEEIAPPASFQTAAIMLAAAPIILIYPFIQKYFTKGIMTGAVKG